MTKENKAVMRLFQELRRGSRTQPHRNKKKYTRKSKHRKKDQE